MRACVPGPLDLTQGKQVTQEHIQGGPHLTPREEPALLSAPPGPLAPSSRPAWLNCPVPCLKNSGLCPGSQVSVVQTPLRSLSRGGEIPGPLPLRPSGVQDRSTHTPFQEPPLPREKVQLDWGAPHNVPWVPGEAAAS